MAPATQTPARRSARRERERGSSHHIDDPLRNDDHLLRRLAVEGAANRVEGEHSRFDIEVAGIPGNGYVRALLAVHLDGKRDRALDQELALDHGPILHREQALVTERHPTFL